MSTRADFWYLVAAGALFGLFVLDVLLGKAALLYEFEPILKLGDVGEFLTLLAAVIFFIIEVLRRESQETELKTKSANAAEEENQ
jgi:Na+-transporting methylmalonyl-CoA/oxaloacetate decarboxylase gamma subunit